MNDDVSAVAVAVVVCTCHDYLTDNNFYEQLHDNKHMFLTSDFNWFFDDKIDVNNIEKDEKASRLPSILLQCKMLA